MKALIDKLLESLSPMQICWLCLLVTMGLGLFSIRTFADNGKVDALRDDVTSLKAELLEQRIFDNRLRQCTASSTEARQFYAGKVVELVNRYRQITSQNYRLPDCDDVR